MAPQRITITAAETRQRIATLRSKLKEIMGPSRDWEELHIEPMADPLDFVRSSVDREVAVQRLDHRTHLIHEIQSALAKIEDGTYGSCERCEAPIAARRLDAVPWARFCISCQSADEAAARETTFKHAA